MSLHLYRRIPATVPQRTGALNWLCSTVYSGCPVRGGGRGSTRTGSETTLHLFYEGVSPSQTSPDRREEPNGVGELDVALLRSGWNKLQAFGTRSSGKDSVITETFDHQTFLFSTLDSLLSGSRNLYRAWDGCLSDSRALRPLIADRTVQHRPLKNFLLLLLLLFFKPHPIHPQQQMVRLSWLASLGLFATASALVPPPVRERALPSPVLATHYKRAVTSWYASISCAIPPADMS